MWEMARMKAEGVIFWEMGVVRNFLKFAREKCALPSGDGGGSLVNMRMELTDYRAWLNRLLAQVDCQTGTLHETAAEERVLQLVAQVGLPSMLLAKIEKISFGAGLVGAAAERGEAVVTGALGTNFAGSVAMPIVSPKTGALLGVLSVGKHQPHDFSEKELAVIDEAAHVIAAMMDRK